MLKFIHFVIDDKFIHDSYRCFQNANLTDNSFYYIADNNRSLNYLKKEEISIISRKEAVEILKSLNHSDIIVLHSLYSLPANLTKYIPLKTKVLWYAWGFDLYSNNFPLKPLITFPKGRLHQATYKTLKKTLRLNEIIKKIKYYLTWFSQNKKKDYVRLIARVNYFAGVFPYEYDLLKDECSYFNAIKIKHDYIHPEEFSSLDIHKEVQQVGNNILLGNSAAYLCNHLDLLYSLYNNTSNRDFKIYCPLSYGGNEYYKRKVIKFGKKLFGEQFIPLLRFLPFEEYTKIIQSCGNVLLGYEQQAATCNCLTSLWNGLKLFVPKSSMNYKEYKMIEGLQVYSLEEDLNDININSALNIPIEEQRKRISVMYSYERWKEDLRDTINILEANL